MRESLTTQTSKSAAATLWHRPGSAPRDVDVRPVLRLASRSPSSSSWRTTASAPRGKAARFAAGAPSTRGGALPNQHLGGHLSEGYLHGMNHVVEGVRRSGHVHQPGARRRGLPRHVGDPGDDQRPWCCGRAERVVSERRSNDGPEVPSRWDRRLLRCEQTSPAAARDRRPRHRRVLRRRRREELAVCACAACGAVLHLPRAYCARCGHGARCGAP